MILMKIFNDETHMHYHQIEGIEVADVETGKAEYQWDKNYTYGAKQQLPPSAKKILRKLAFEKSEMKRNQSYYDIIDAWNRVLYLKKLPIGGMDSLNEFLDKDSLNEFLDNDDDDDDTEDDDGDMATGDIRVTSDVEETIDIH